MRDVAVDLGLPVTVEDTGGSDIDTAAMAHLSLSTPEELRIHTVDFNAWVTVGNADRHAGGRGRQAARAEGAGLGVEVSRVLGEPFGVWTAGADTAFGGLVTGHQARAAAPIVPAAAAEPGDDERAHDGGRQGGHDDAVAEDGEAPDERQHEQDRRDGQRPLLERRVAAQPVGRAETR